MKYLGKLRQQIWIWKQIRMMRTVVMSYGQSAIQSGTFSHLVIVPSDPWTLIGAKGDEAMMQSVVQQFRLQSPNIEVAVITATPQAEDAARSLGFLPIAAWSCAMSEGIIKLKAYGADSMVVLGADVMDGYYGPLTTARMLFIAEAAARFGARVSILGFSFNATPNRQLRNVFNQLDKSITVNVRDRISQTRFQRFSHLPSQLVADAAFMLQPERSATVRTIVAWAESRREQGDLVLGFNMHPMLIRNATPRQIKAFIQSATVALKTLSQRRAVSLLLISHDYRGNDGDDICLRPIAASLATELQSRLNYPTQIFSAAQLKAIAGCTDGVITGRMHLAIASLGMQRPVAAMTYQDKFQGLFLHFEYPERFLLSSAGAADPTQLLALMEDFLDQLPALGERVRMRLPTVMKASAANLDVFRVGGSLRPSVLSR